MNEDFQKYIADILYRLSDTMPKPIVIDEEDENFYQTLQWLKDNNFVYFPNNEESCIRYQGPTYESVSSPNIMVSVTTKGLNLLNVNINIEEQNLANILKSYAKKGTKFVINATITAAINYAFSQFS